MRILYLCPHYTSPGGAAIHARRLAEEMVRRGHQVTLGSEAPANQTCLRPDVCGGTVLFLKRSLFYEKCLNQLVLIAQYRGGYRLLKMLKSYTPYELLRSGPICKDLEDVKLYAQYDVVHLISGCSFAWFVHLKRVCSRLSDTLKVVSPLTHPYELDESFSYVKKVLADFDVVNTSTPFETEYLTSQGLDLNRLHHVGVGSDAWTGHLDSDQFRGLHGIARGVPVVLFLGRKVFHKGVVHVVQAMDRVWDYNPEAMLLLVGFSHNGRDWLAEYLTQSRHDALHRTVDLDDVSEEDKENALASCTVMAAPSINDSFGIVYLDAWKHKKPIVGCRHTCCESFIRHGSNGYLVEFGNVDQIAEALLDVITHPEKSAMMGANGYDLWEKRYTWSHIAEKTEAMYEEYSAMHKAVNSKM